MIWDHIEKLRQNIEENSNLSLPYDKWPMKLMNKTNCLAFALGLSADLGEDYLDYGYVISSNPEFYRPDFSVVFERLLTELGLKWRKISSPNDALKNEFVIQTYGFYNQKEYPYYNFHVIRRELDGTWVHKPCFNEAPEIIKWKCFNLEYPDSEISGIYAVTKKAP